MHLLTSWNPPPPCPRRKSAADLCRLQRCISFSCLSSEFQLHWLLPSVLTLQHSYVFVCTYVEPPACVRARVPQHLTIMSLWNLRRCSNGRIPGSNPRAKRSRRVGSKPRRAPAPGSPQPSHLSAQLRPQHCSAPWQRQRHTLPCLGTPHTNHTYTQTCWVYRRAAFSGGRMHRLCDISICFQK